MKFEFPPPDAATSGGGSGSDDVIATGGFAAWSHSDRWGQMPHVEDWRGFGGDNSDTNCLLSAIAAAKVEGGMRLRVAAATYTVEETLLIDSPHVSLHGQGAGWFRPGALIHDSPRTKFLWEGAAGGTIVKFVTPITETGRLHGGGLTGIQLDGNAFSAARGLWLETWIRAFFEDVVVFACSESQFRLGVVQYLLNGTPNPTDVSYNRFHHCLATTVSSGGGLYTDSTAIGWHLTGGSPVKFTDTCVNNFWDCHAYMSKGIGWKLECCDSNTFHYCVGGSAFGDATVFGFELGSADQDSSVAPLAGHGGARHNSFFGLAGTIHARSSQVGDGPSGANVVWGNSRANNVPRPVIEPPVGGGDAATLSYWDTEGHSHVHFLALTEDVPIVPPTLPDQVVSQLYIADVLGPLKLKDSAANIRTILDTGSIDTWTPVFAFATPGDSVITHTIQSGKCLKLGNFVFLWMDLRFNTNAYTTAAGGASISGLPFPATLGGSFNVSYMDRVTFTAAQPLRLHIANGASAMTATVIASDAVTTFAGIAQFPPSKTAIRLFGTGMYWAADA